jgi:hypothetical protein
MNGFRETAPRGFAKSVQRAAFHMLASAARVPIAMLAVIDVTSAVVKAAPGRSVAQFGRV